MLALAHAAVVFRRIMFSTIPSFCASVSRPGGTASPAINSSPTGTLLGPAVWDGSGGVSGMWVE